MGSKNGRRVIRVLLVINRLEDQGGAEVSTLSILNELQGPEFDFAVVTLFGEADFAGRAKLVERGARFLAAPRGLARRLKFVDRLVRSWRPDVLHSTLFDADVITRVVGPLRRVPVLSSLVNTEFSHEAMQNARSPRRLGVIRLIGIVTGRLGVSHYHAITAATAAHGVERLRIPPERITVVPRGRDTLRLGRRSDERRAATRSSLGVSDSQIVVLNVARREPQKGQVELIRAFRQFRVDEPGSVLFVAGREGSSSEALRQQVSRFGLEDAVHFLGTRTDVPDLLSAADLFVFSSLWEGLGGALIEALALEVPVITFDIAAAREVVRDCGIRVPIGDSMAMAAAMVEAVRDRKTSLERARAGRQRFETLYSVRSMCDGMAELYLRTPELRPPPILRFAGAKPRPEPIDE